MPPPSLRRNFAWVFSGSLMLSLSQFALIIGFAKLAGAQAAGDWTLALAITAPVFIFFQLKLRQVQATDARGENTWSEFVSVRLAGMAGALVVVGGVVVVQYRDVTGLAILAVGLARACEGGSDLVYGHRQRDEQMGHIARSQMGRGLTSAGAAGLLLVITHSALWTAVGMAAAYAAWMLRDVAALRADMTGQEFGPSRDRRRIFALIRTAAPLGLVTAIGSLQVNLPRYFLEGHATRAELGVFSSLAQLLLLGSVVVGALAQAAVPRMARQAAGGDWQAFSRQLLRLIGLGLALGLAAVVVAATIGEPLLRLVYSEEYARHSEVLVWLAITSGLLWSYVFLGTALNAMRRFGIQPWIHGVSTLVIAVVAALAVPEYRLRGAAWAMLSGYVVECLLYVIAVALPLRSMARAQS